MSITARTTARRTIATLTATGLLAGSGVALLAGPAQAIDRSGTCAGARFDLSVDADDGGIEVESDIDDAAAGSTWRVVLKQDGKRYLNRTYTADNEGEISVDRFRADTPGTDVFSLKVKDIASGQACKISVTV